MADTRKTGMSGQPDCPKCHGRGVVENGLFSVEPCECTILKYLVKNVDRGWKGLLSAPTFEGESPLLKLAKGRRNLWITADRATLRMHMKHTALRMPHNWGFNVVSDADLMTSWLATAGLAGLKIVDPDIMASAAPVSLRKLTLVDLVEPPDTLIVVLGVKAARNQAMPEVLAEAISLRESVGKSMWIVDQPDKPLREGHRAWSPEVRENLYEFEMLTLQSTAKGRMAPVSQIPSEAPKASGGRGRSRRNISNGKGRTRSLPNGGGE